MATRLGGIRGSATAIRLLQSGLAASTAQGYGNLFARFAEFCDEEGVSALPATTATVISYIGHLADLGTWAASSMQPIFSAINDAHRSLELPPPACDSFFLKRVRTGLGRVQAAVTTTDARTPLPAEAVLAFIDAAEALPDAELRHLREYAALALTALFAGRQDSSVHLRSGDIGIENLELWLRLSEKGKRQQSVRRIVRLPLSPSSADGHASALPRVGALLARYFAARARISPQLPEFAFQLPGEQRPTTACMERWLDHALTRCRIRPPPGFAYLGHSLRSLGASAMAAIG
ncbi:integrase family protein, partial [Chrysochromulina tobinii]